MTAENTPSGAVKSRGPGARKALALLILVCVAPVVASYLAYYFLPPDGRVNYGDLIDPQQDVTALWTVPLAETLPADEAGRLQLDTPLAPEIAARTGPTDASAAIAAVPGVSLAGWRGRWLMVVAGPGACNEVCQGNLYNTRQVRLTTGKYRDRIQRLWLVTDDTPPDPAVLADHSGLVAARVDPNELSALFQAAPDSSLSDHIFLVDPLGNLMMRFPGNPDASRIKKDILRLLKASRIG